MIDLTLQQEVNVELAKYITKECTSSDREMVMVLLDRESVLFPLQAHFCISSSTSGQTH